MVTSVRAAVKNAVVDRIPGLLRRGPTTVKRVALTFDDGPDDLTGDYLELLDHLGIPGTFFVSGKRAAERPEMIREYVRRGHQVANHGYDHTRFTKLSRKDLLDQVERTDHIIGGQLTGRSWVRPPHGAINTNTLVTLRAAGYLIALWSIDTKDHVERDPEKVAERCRFVAPGDVLLFHEGKQSTLQALPLVVASLHGAGYECVTMHDLFAR